MPRLSATVLAVACFAAAAHGQYPFPLGPGPLPPTPVVDPAINDYICRAVVDHAMSATFCRIKGMSVELVSSRWQGEQVYVFSRVYWSRHDFLTRKAVTHMAEVQYSMVQRRFYRRIYDLYLTNTDPIIYQYYDLGRVRTKINDELERFDKIAGDSIFPGPWPRGPSTVVPQIATSTLNTPSTVPGMPGQNITGVAPNGAIIAPTTTIYAPQNIVTPPPVVVPTPSSSPTVNIVPAPPGTRPDESRRTPQTPSSSTGAPPPR